MTFRKTTAIPDHYWLHRLETEADYTADRYDSRMGRNGVVFQPQFYTNHLHLGGNRMEQVYSRIY